MLRSTSFGLLYLVAALAVAQESPASLVLNGSFEEYSAPPLGWYYAGDDFTRVMKYWESPTAASPDVYGPKGYVPSHWQDKGFGHATPHSGESMVGITVLGCDGGKPHCREYLQIQLTESLVAGQRYELTYWVRPLPRSMRIRQISASFTEQRMESPTDELLDLSPVAVPGAILADEGWSSVRREFFAAHPAGYLVLGNFLSDDETDQQVVVEDGGLTFAYYYVDDVALVKLPPILEVPLAENDLRKEKLEKGRTVTLKNIYFDHDKADFLPRSYQELNLLVGIMHDNPDMTIEIKGHTDNIGTDAYNQELSLARARAVWKYLLDNGITQDHVSFKGYGSTMPVATNDTDTGRQQNRRVEFLILSY